MAFVPAFVPASVTAFRVSHVSVSKRCALAPVRARRAAARRVAPAPVRMSSYWEGDYPPSDVLGIGKEVPSSLYILASAVALVLGSYCVYQSNLISPLSAGSVNPQFIVGSLLVPISWGLHVAGWIQGKNSK